MMLLSKVKNALVSRERKPRGILHGPFSGIVMGLSLRTESQIYLGLFERETHQWLHRLSTGIATAIDIGVAHGEHTLFFLIKTKASKVLAFEPDPLCLPLIQENLSSNGLAHNSRLEICTKYVGSTDNEVEVSLDSLAGSVRTPCLIKMDVDGGEFGILNGAKEFNKQTGVRWLIETHSEELEAGCEALLRASGFETRVIRNAWWRFMIPEHRVIAHNRWLVAWKA